MTAFLGPLVVAGAFTAIRENVKLFYAMVFFIQFAMLGAFVAQDLFLFYLFWETMLIPMFLLIGIWGGERRIYATFKFVLYTAFGSILMLAALIYLVYTLQTTTGVTSFAFADLYQDEAAGRRADRAAGGLRAVVRDQGADGAAAHVAAGRARRGADRGFRDPGRRPAEDGNVRLSEAGLPAVSGRDAAADAGAHDAGGDQHHLRRLPGAGAGGHQEDHRLLVDQSLRLRDARSRQPRSHRHPGRDHPDGEPWPHRGRIVPDGGDDLRALPHARAGGLRRPGQAVAGVLALLHDPHAGVDRTARDQRFRRRVPGASRQLQGVVAAIPARRSRIRWR